MNRRTMIVATAVVVIGAFAAGTLLYSPAGQGLLPGGHAEAGPPLVRPHAPVLGPVDAPVTIVEFFDPACETCRAFHPVVKKIMATYPEQVRVVLRYAAFHPPSAEAVRILEAARDQGVFEAVLERLLAAQPRWAPHGRAGESPWAVLDGTGLDLERAARDAKAPAVDGVLKQDAEDVQAAGVRATPTFFVNGKPLQTFGAQQLFDLVTAAVQGQ